MTTIHMLHGCALHWQADLQSTRNFVAEDTLIQYLAARPSKYGPLSNELTNDVLTIDDSTVGAGRACELARQAGHEVTLFINPAQIVRQCRYWFTRLDAILDARTVRTVEYRGNLFDLNVGASLRGFRLAVKSQFMPLDEEQTHFILDELADRLGSGSPHLPDHAQTLSLERLRRLQELGVSIQSHGWGHRDIASMRSDEIAADLHRARGWLQSALSLDPPHYAVPYGLSPMPPPAAVEVKGLILLADSAKALGPADQQHWNRQDITGHLQRSSI